jgi:predicted AAA+ superfamily ATPase
MEYKWRNRKRKFSIYTIRKEFKEKLIEKIKEEFNCILLIGPRASGKTSTVQDLENNFEDTLFF